jgi:hypothetical protein
VPQTLTLTQLQNLKTQVKNGGLSAASDVYKQLDGMGYHYGGWGDGVLTGGTFTGQAAVSFLENSAEAGVGGKAPRTLSEADLNKIRLDMANGYLDTLIKKADPKTGLVSEDVTFRETQEFHGSVFEKNNLTLDNWTLQLPMALYRNAFGDAAAEGLWRSLRETSGNGLDGVIASSLLWDVMYAVKAFSVLSGDTATVSKINAWGQQMGPATLVFDFAKMLNTAYFNPTGAWLGGQVWGLQSEITRLFTSSVTVGGPGSPLVLDLDGDGVETTSKSGLTYFDHDRNGFAERTGWAGSDDGLLVRDLNKNGQIDDGGELFGDNTLVNDMSAACAH